MSFARLPLAIVLLSAIGCATLQPVHDPAQFITQNHPSVVLVTYSDNSTVPVSQPRISGDTLFGADSVVAPLHDVTLVRATQRDNTRTFLMIGGLTAFTVAGVYALSQAVGNNSCFNGGFHAVGGETGTTTTSC